MQWMLWITPTVVFFIAMALLLVYMTVWEIVQPNVERRGKIIPMRTTRGDRLFIALLVAAFASLFWLVLVPASMWWMIGITVVLIVVMLRWG